MFHTIKSVNALSNYRLCVLFEEGITKIYDVKPLFAKWDCFKVLAEKPGLFSRVSVDIGGHGLVWNDELDLSCDELFVNGKTTNVPVDELETDLATTGA